MIDFAVPNDHKVKLKESEKDKYQDFAEKLKKSLGHDDYTSCNLCSWCSYHRIDTRTGGLENITREEHLNCIVIKIIHPLFLLNIQYTDTQICTYSFA